MTQIIATDNVSLIIGGGLTGLSVARYFERTSQRYRVWDTRSDEKYIAPFKALNNDVECYSGAYTESIFSGINQIVLSPGVSRSERFIQDALKKSISVRGDVSLFLADAKAPVIGITGSNGKSTVTTMVGMAAKKAGINAAVGGNIGVPALDLLDQPVELYVLELSSFQLESTDSAGLFVAVNLNVSPDHLDHHGSMQAYFQAKQKIFHRADRVVYNLSDALTQPPMVAGMLRFGFGLQPKSEKHERQFCYNTEAQLLESDGDVLMPKSDVCQKSMHNIENALALFAIAAAADIPAQAAQDVVREFKGLSHRCEVVAELDGVLYINDSKATNVGSALAAIEGFASETEGIVWIAGGDAKGADFTELANRAANIVKHVVLIGRDAENIEKAIAGRVAITYSLSLTDAVVAGKELASDGDVVLFSPACASFDMFDNFEHRGDCFKQAVNEVAA